MSPSGWLLVLVGSAAAHLAAVGLALSAAGARAGPAVILDLIAGPSVEEPLPPRSLPPLRRAAPPRPAPMMRSAAARPPVTPAAPLLALEPPATAPEPVSPPAPVTASRLPAAAVGAPPSTVAAAPPAAAAPAAPAPRDEAAGVMSEVAAGRLGAGGGAAERRLAAGGGPVASSAAAKPPAASEAGSGGPLALALSGDGRGGFPAEYGPYLARFRERVQDALAYPLAARRRGLAGQVELEVLIEPAGEVQSARVIASSSHPALDEAALQAVRSLPPLPLPGNLPRRPLRVRLPLSFELR